MQHGARVAAGELANSPIHFFFFNFFSNFQKPKFWSAAALAWRQASSRLDLKLPIQKFASSQFDYVIRYGFMLYYLRLCYNLKLSITSCYQVLFYVKFLTYYFMLYYSKRNTARAWRQMNSRLDLKLPIHLRYKE